MAECPVIYVDMQSGGATQKINSAIALANDPEDGGGVVQFGPGPYAITAPINPITRKDVVLRGCDSLTTLVAQGSYAGIGNFFRFGDATSSANDSGLMNFRFEIAKSAPPLPNNDVFAVEFVNGVDMWGTNIEGSDLAGVMKFGGDTTPAKRCRIANWRGDISRGGQTMSNYLFQNCTGIRLTDVNFSGNVETTGQGSLMRIKPLAGNIVDGLRFTRCGGQFTVAESAGEDVTGKPRGVFIDRGAAPVTNVVFDNCIFDHTTVMAVEFSATDAASAGAYTRLIRFNNCRLFTDSGGGIRVSHTGAGIVRNIMVTGCNISVEDDSAAFRLSAEGKQVGLVLVNNTFCESSAVTKDGAVYLNGNNWICANNNCCTVSADGVERFIKAYIILGNGSDGFLMGPNLAAPGIQKLQQPGSYTVNPGTRQII